MEATDAQHRRPHRLRWYQFSLRTLLLLMLLANIGVSWFATRMHRQREAVEAILKCDCEVACDGDSEDVFVRDVVLVVQVLAGKVPARPPPTWAERLFGKDFLRRAVSVGVPLAKVPGAAPP